MSENLALNELIERIEKRKNEEIERIEQIEKEKLRELSEKLSEFTRSEISTTSDAIASELIKMRKLLIGHEKAVLREMESFKKTALKRSIISILAVASLIIGIGIGAWGLSAYISHQLRQISELKMAEKQIAGYRPIKKIYNNGIELRKGYKARLGRTRSGTTFIIVEEE